MCYLVAGCLPAPLGLGAASRLLLLGVDHSSSSGLRGLVQVIPLLRTEVYEWAKGLSGEG
jgi:hypothetical protein